MKRLTKYALVATFFGSVFFTGGLIMMARGNVDGLAVGGMFATIGAATTGVGCGLLSAE